MALAPLNPATGAAIAAARRALDATDRATRRKP